MELGDILAGDEAEGRGIQVDFQVGTLNPLDLSIHGGHQRCLIHLLQIKTRSQDTH